MLLFKTAALRIVDNLRRRFARFKLCAHLLHIRSLTVASAIAASCCKSLLLVTRKLLMFFEKLVEKHRVHRFVENGVWLSKFIGKQQAPD